MTTPTDQPAPAPGDESPLPPPAEETRPGPGLPFDPWRLAAAIVRRWKIIVLSGVILAALGAAAGRYKFTSEYKASAQLMRQESAATFRASELGEPFKPRQLSVPTLVSLMKSPAVLQRVSEEAQLSVRAIAGGLTVTPERNTDLISLSFVSSRTAATAVRVVNAFGNEVVRLTREMQRQESAEMNSLLKRQVAKAEDDLRTVNRELLDFSREAGLINADKEIDAYLRTLGDLDLRFEATRIDYETFDLKISALERELAANNPLGERVLAAREKLAELLQQYTDANPLVQEQKTTVADLEARLKEAASRPLAPPRQGESGLAAGFYAELLHLRSQKEVTAAQLEKLKTTRTAVEEKLRGLPEKGMQLARIRARQQSLEAAQSLLASRQREAQVYEENTPGYYRFFESRLEEVDVAGRGKKLVLLSVAGGVFGAFLALALVGVVESFDDRLKTTADLKRATGLPLLGTLPDLQRLTAGDQPAWAFRTWMALQSRLAADAAGHLVCGFVSATAGEGRSTWVEFLARAASQRNETVIAVTNRPPPNGTTLPLAEALEHPGRVALVPGRPTWLIAPADWSWTAERRARWPAAVAAWRQPAGVVVLLELPAADQPETLLFAEELPQLVWLARSGAVRGRAISELLETFQHGGCRFVGAILNHEPKLFPWS